MVLTMDGGKANGEGEVQDSSGEICLGVFVLCMRARTEKKKGACSGGLGW